ncbi:hypothetical protein FRC11_005911, partial [Ceratobasidium sp. 423]
MSHINETASDIDYEYPDDENLDAEWDPEPELDKPPRDPEPEATTQHQEQYEAILVVVNLMNEHGLRLDTLVHALCYGNPLCTAESGSKQKPLKTARNELMKSPLLPKILNNLHTPPCYMGRHPQAASKALNQWAWNHTIRLSQAELDRLAANEHTDELHAKDPMERLTDFENLRLSNLTEKMTKFTPNLVRFLTAVGETKPQACNRHRTNPDTLFNDIEPSF